MAQPLLRSPHADLPQRRPVWEALSVLFLDTALTDADITAVAMVLAASPYSDEELAAIYHAEVTPACRSNIGMAPGFWDGFPDGWVEQAILSRGLDASQALAGLAEEQRRSWGWGGLRERSLLQRTLNAAQHPPVDT
jgi:hypothetical protein